MAATQKLKVNFSFTRKGLSKRWSTSFHFDGGIPTDAEFQTWANDIVTNATVGLRASFYSDVTIEDILYYAAGSDIASKSRVIGIAGTITHSSDTQLPGDAAALVRWSTTQRTTKNHPIYLFNYLHGCRGQTGTAGDLLNANQKSNMQDHMNKWVSGWTVGSHTIVRAGPNGAIAQAATVEQYVTHRDFRK